LLDLKTLQNKKRQEKEENKGGTSEKEGLGEEKNLLGSIL